MNATPAPPDPTAGDVLDTGAAGGLAIRGGAVRVAGYLAGALLTLVSVPLLVRHLGIEDFGRYFTVVSLIGLVGGITDVGLTTVATREYTVRRGAARDALMRAVLGARLLLTSVGVLIAAGFAAVAGYGTELVVGTVAAGAGLAIAVVHATLVVPLTTALKLGLVSLLDLARIVLAVTATIAFVVAGLGVVWFLAVPALTGLPVLVATVILTRGTLPLRPSLQLGELYGLLRETLPVAVATILNVLYARLVIIVMSLVATEQAVGFFGASYRIVEVLIGIPAALIGTAFPILARAARDDHERLRFAVHRMLEVALLGGVGMTLITAVGADVAMEVLGGDEADGAAPVLRLLAVALTPIFVGMALGNALLALRLHRQLILVNAVGLALVGVLAFALVPPLGAEGGALAVVIAELALVNLSLISLVRAYPNLRPGLRVVPRVAVAVLAAVGAVLLVDLGDVLDVALAAVVYVGLLALLRAIPPELVSAFVERIKPRSDAVA